MSWIRTPPWNHNVNLLPCIAAGIYYQGGGALQRTTSTIGHHNYLDNLNRPSIERSIIGRGCISQESPYSIYITLEIDPDSIDVGETFKFYQNKILVNNYSIDTDNASFTVTKDEIFTYLIKLDGLDKIEDFLSLSSLDVKVFICKSAEYLEESKILFNCSFLITKGPALDVSSIFIENNILTISFNAASATNCTCSTTCIPISGIGIICNDKQTNLQYRLIQNALNTFSFNLTDNNGNIKNIDIGILKNVIPNKPFVSVVQLKDRQIAIVSGNRKSTSNEALSSYVKYFQIERYIDSEQNRSIIYDWIDILNNDYINDESVLPEKTYAYRIRYMGSYGDISNWSDWTISETSVNIASTWIDDEVYY